MTIGNIKFKAARNAMVLLFTEGRIEIRSLLDFSNRQKN